MSDPIELADSLADSSIEVVGSVSPGDTPYQIKVSAALQTAISTNTSNVADHETRIDALEGGAGTGDFDGPGSSTDNAVVRFDGTTGKLGQNSVVTIADSTGNMAGVGTLNTRTIANWVDGPASAVDNTIVRFDSTTGKLVQGSAVTVADTTGSIDNTSGSGTVTSTRFIGPATGLRETTGPTDLTMGAVADGQTLIRSGSSIIGSTPSAGTGVSYEFWVPPGSAGSGPGGAVDEELLSGGLPAFFTAYTTAGVALTRDGDVDTSVSPASNHYRSRVGYRGKGLLYQAAVNQSQMLAHQFSSSALNADWTFRIRMGVASHLATNGTGSCMVYFCRDNGSGVPDQTNNFMRFGWLSSATADTMFLHTANFISGGGGGSPLGGMTSGNIWPMIPDGEFVVRHKNGVQVSVYFVPTNGGCQEILRVTSPIPLIFATSNPWLIIRFGTQGSGADPAMYQVRYWRWENTFASIP